MFVQNVAKHSWLIPVAVCACLTAALPVRGQAPPAQPGEIKAVVRISKGFIEDVIGRLEITAAVPFNAEILGFDCTGVIDGQAKLAVEMTAAQGNATFVVNSHGTAQTYVEGVCGPIVVKGPAWGPFTTRTTVRFEGRKFSLMETTPWAEVHADLDSVEGRYGSCVGRGIGRVAVPFGKLLIPRAEAEATPIGLYILTEFVNKVAGELTARLSRTTAVEKSLNRLFPETKDWVFQMSADSQFLQAAYGPKGSKVPDLPENPGRLKDVRLELWLHSTATEAQDLAKLSREPLARELANRYIETILPELAALTENRSLDSAGPWLVISIGAPKAK
jgi:hypothetical protein